MDNTRFKCWSNHVLTQRIDQYLVYKTAISDCFKTETVILIFVAFLI